ncbi:diheme cytochrome c [Candidatus Venteria ishoeyi]|uniref:Dihaem cytochrome c n=1 Tax=Candidatus Venteria ishoeyi TaxID=1899563 RepID=A0A1H6F2W5_9GAMM|nr:diheme cytochrome c [Candidatus Venteria ishoeyi]MDM8547719.1 diheme cytochrome c [Candidatus Venteria ishoeyi]SEH04412.1 Dihaem cytochrome c [Candidatus Venteria ishoeyi]
MNEKTLYTLSATALILSAGLYAAFSFADDDDDDHDYGKNNKYQIHITNNPSYQEECGACHIAYPSALLPARSWQKIMSGLSDHFGENAELEAATQAQLTEYLSTHSAEHDKSYLPQKLLRRLPSGQTPLRISELPYLRHEHKEIPVRMISNNPKVKSISQCNHCHTQADKGSFAEREINIPGVGRWDD